MLAATARAVGVGYTIIAATITQEALMLLSDHDIDAAVQHAAIEQERLAIVCCPECLSGRLARRLAMIAPLLRDRPDMIELLIARAAADAVQDVIEGRCPGDGDKG